MEQTRSSISVRRLIAEGRPAWLAGIVGGLFVLAAAGLMVYYITGGGDSSTQHQPKGSATGIVASPGEYQPNGSATGIVASPGEYPPSRYGEMDLQIAYGTTPKQVLRQIGSPTTKQADCWIYRGQSIRGRYSGTGIDGIKFCFSEGATGNKVVTQIFNHTPAHTIINKDPVTHAITKKHYPAQWFHAVTFLKVPDWYLQQNS